MERSSDAPSAEAPVTLGDLAYGALRKQRERLLANEPGTRLGHDPEALHDMRVATRRLRAALAVFAETVPRRGERLRRELRWLGRALGEVRDLDVQLERLAAQAAQDPALEPAASAVSQVLSRRRESGRRRMLRALDSRRYGRLLEALGALVEAGPPSRARAARRSAALVAPDIVKRAYKKMRRAGERLTPESPPEEFHRMRIRAKRLRYALEFHASLYGRPAEDLVSHLVAIQDQLGVHQDCQVMLQLIDEVRQGRGKRLPPGAMFAMGTLAERVARNAATLRRQFPRQLRAVRGRAWKRVKSAFDARVAATVRPPRRARRAPKPEATPPTRTEATGDTSWTASNPPQLRSTPRPPTSTAS